MFRSKSGRLRSRAETASLAPADTLLASRSAETNVGCSGLATRDQAASFQLSSGRRTTGRFDVADDARISSKLPRRTCGGPVPGACVESAPGLAFVPPQPITATPPPRRTLVWMTSAAEWL